MDPNDIYDQFGPSGAPAAPDAVTPAIIAEGARIRASLANGTYGTGAIPNQASPAVTVVAPTPLIQGNFGASGMDWSQADWGKTGSQLFRDARLDDLRQQAEQRKLANEQAIREAPLQDQLLSARANAAGAHTRFLQGKDLETLQHTANFFNDLSHPDAPSPASPDYTRYVWNSLSRNPGFANTAGGRGILEAMAKGQAVHNSVADLAGKLNDFGPGFEIAGGTIGAGNQSTIRVQPKGVDQAKELRSTYGLTSANIKNPVQLTVGRIDPKLGFVGDDTGDYVKMKGPKGNTVTMPAAAYEGYGGTYSPATTALRTGPQAAAPVATPAAKHLGTYNPKTNEFE